MSTPFISIITINYNNALGLKKTIESVVNQSYLNYEYVIIDGGSKDESVDIIKSFESKITTWISESDKGIYDALNKGINIANGKYLVFLNSGDVYLHDDVLTECVNIINHNDAAVYYGQIIVDEGSGDRVVAYPQQLTLAYQRNMVINHQACFFDAQTLKTLGAYNTKYKLAADYAYYLLASINQKKFVAIPFPIVRYDVSGISSVRMDDYRKEMKQVWADIIPHYITEVVDELNEKSKQINTIQSSRFYKIKQLIDRFRHGKK